MRQHIFPHRLQGGFLLIVAAAVLPPLAVAVRVGVTVAAEESGGGRASRSLASAWQ